MRRDVKAARERIEAVACTNIGSEPRLLLLAPNDLRRAVDGLDEAEAEIKSLRSRLRRQKVMHAVNKVLRGGR